MRTEGLSTGRTRLAVLVDVVTHYRVELFNALAARHELELSVFSCPPRRSSPHFAPLVAPAFARAAVSGLHLRGARSLHPRFVPLGAPRQIATWRPDVVLAGMTTSLALAGLAAAHLAHAPFVWWVDVNAKSDRVLSPRAFLPIKRALARRAVVSVASSISAREYVVGLGAPRSRVVIAPLAIDSRGYAARVDAARPGAAALLERLGIEPPVVLFCGRLHPHKGVLGLVDAVATAAEGGPRATLLVVGEGQLAAKLRRRAGALGVRLVLAGPRQPADLPVFYAAADVFCLPSIQDAFGVVVAEAAAAGLPLLVSRHAGAADHLVEDGVNGWRVDPADGAAVAAHVRHLLGDPDLRARMGAESRRIAFAHSFESAVTAIVGGVTRAHAGAPFAA